MFQTTHTTGTGRRSVQQSIGTAKYFHSFNQLGSNKLARQDAVQAVVGHVVGIDVEATNNVQVLEVAIAFGGGHGWVVGEHIRDAAGHLFLDQGRGIGGAAERAVEVVEVAENTGAAAAGNIATGKGIENIHLG